MKNLKNFKNIILLTAIIAVVGLAGYFIFKAVPLPQPAPPTVSFDGVPKGNSGAPVVIKSNIPTEETGLAKYPDETLASVPATPITVKFLVEHRSALNGKTVTVKGTVVNIMLGDAPCRPDLGSCGKQKIFLADTKNENRNKDYDLVVFVDENDMRGYTVGKIVEVRGVVASNKMAVSLSKIY